MRLSTLLILLSIFLMGCRSEESNSKADKAQYGSQAQETIRSVDSEQSQADTVADSNASPQEYKIHFTRDQRYGSTDSVVVGEMAGFTVDVQNRVYIADMDKTTIHVFHPQGSYLQSLGRQGPGPAEFAAVTPNTSMRIHANRLYVTDYDNPTNFFPTRMQIFALDDLSFARTMKLIPENRDEYSMLEKHLPINIYPRDDGTLLVGYRRSPSEYKDTQSFIRYMIQDSTGHILKGPILEQQDRKNLTYIVRGGGMAYEAISTFPFLEKSMLAISADGDLYTARSGTFEIDVHQPDGEYVRTITHPLDNQPLDIGAMIDYYERTGEKSSLGDGVAVKMIQEAENLPDEWPVLRTMLFDDENQLWVGTYVEDDEIYRWWMMDKNRDVITKFNWPREKTIRTVRNGVCGKVPD